MIDHTFDDGLTLSRSQKSKLMAERKSLQREYDKRHHRLTMAERALADFVPVGGNYSDHKDERKRLRCEIENARRSLKAWEKGNGGRLIYVS